MASVCATHRGPALGKPTAIEKNSQRFEQVSERRCLTEKFRALHAGPMKRPPQRNREPSASACSQSQKHDVKLIRNSRTDPSLCRTRLTARR